MKPRISQLAQSGATDGQVATWSAALSEWVPASPAAVTPLLSDSDGSAMVSDDGTDWLYPG